MISRQKIYNTIKEAAFAPQAKVPLLEQDDLVWFNELKNQFKTVELPATETDPVKKSACEIINQVIGKPKEQLDGQDLADLETWLVEVLPMEDLRQKVSSLRDDCRELAGEDAWSKILPTLTNQVATADEKSLRAEARRLQQELHWRGSIQPEAQRIRVTLMLKVLRTFFFILIGDAILVLFKVSTFDGVVILAGALGALISCIQRIQSADLCSSRATSMAKSDRLTLGVAISPLLGGVFAILALLLLLTGQVKPGFVIPDVTVSSPSHFVLVAGESKKAELSGWVGGGTKVTMTDSGPSRFSSAELDTTNGGRGVDGGAASKTAPSSGKGEMPERLRYDFFTLELDFADGKDLVLLVLWSFVAGFSERLVPDLLTRLADSKKG